MDTAFLLGSTIPDGSVLASALAIMGSLAMGVALGVVICLTRPYAPGGDAAADHGAGEHPAGTTPLQRR